MIRDKVYIKIMQFFAYFLMSFLTIGISYGQSHKQKPKAYNRSGKIPSYLLLGTDFTSQQSVTGSEFGLINQPYFSEAITYAGKKNFDLTAQGGLSLNADTSYSETAYDLLLNGGYTIKINPGLSFRTSYTHAFYSSNSSPIQSFFNDFIQLGTQYSSWHYALHVNTAWLLGVENIFYTNISNSYNWNFTDMLGKNTVFGVSIELDMSFTNKNCYNKQIFNDWDSEEFLAFVSANFYNLFPIVQRQVADDGLERVKDSFQRFLETAKPEDINPNYQFTSLNFSLPLDYSFGKFYLYMIPQFNLPLSSSIFYEQTMQFIINAGVSYSIFL